MMSNKTSASTNKRSRTNNNEVKTTSTSSLLSLSSFKSSRKNTQTSSANIPIYDIHEVVYVLANVGYTEEVNQFVFVSPYHYQDERLLLPLQYQPYGKNDQNEKLWTDHTLFQSACALGHIDRVKELLRYNADPDFVFEQDRWCRTTNLSGLAEALLHGHFEVVEYLMTHYYEPRFRDWERRNNRTTADNIPVTHPIPKDKGNKWNEYQVPSSKNISLFSSLQKLTFHDSSFRHVPLRLTSHHEIKVNPNMLKAFHALLYRSIPNPGQNPNTNAISTYSCFWKCAIAKKWLINLVGWMIMCNESHSYTTVIDTINELVPTTGSHTDSFYLALPYNAALHVGNIPLFWTLAEPLCTTMRDIRYILRSIVCYGTVDLLREFQQHVMELDMNEIEPERFRTPLLLWVGKYALDNPDPFAMLKYLRDHVPRTHLPLDDVTLAAAAALGRLDVIQFLRHEVYPPCEWNESACDYAAKHGRLEVLQWLRSQKPPCPWSAYTYNDADNPEIRQWLVDNGCPTEIDFGSEEEDDNVDADSNVDEDTNNDNVSTNDVENLDNQQ